MNSFFDIKSVAIVWASTEVWKIGNTLLENLSFFEWEKYWVNLKWWNFEWIEFFKSISNLPIIPDILVFSIPAKFVLDSLIQAWEKWVKRVIIISSWFKEVWNIELENKLIEVSKKYWISLLGPNCLWYIDTNKKLNLSFWARYICSCIWDECQNIAMVSQSWAMAVALTDWAISRKMWFSKMISMWNKAWINENDLLLELEKDSETKVIALYLESIELWEEFFKITKRLSKKYPIILVKSGVSEKWSKAANSHTWALSSQKEILYTAFKNSWIHFTQSLENFFLWSQIFSKTNIQKVPEELVIITNAGWPWVMATDHTENYNVKLTEFNKDEKEILKVWLPESASVANPIDIIWDATSKTYEQILNNISKLVKKRSILILLTAQSITDVEDIAEVIINFKKNNPEQFIMVSFMGWEWVDEWREILAKAWILEYDYPKKAIRAFSRLSIQKKWQEKEEDIVGDFKLPNNLEELKSKLKQEEKFCSNALTEEILESFNINTIKEILVNSEEEVKNAYDKLDADLLVARISSPDIPHKTDVGWVILSIKSKKEAIEAYNKILENIKNKAPNAIIKWITFSKMAIRSNLSREIFVWFKRDQSFWNILIVWMWWLFVNIFEDVSRWIWIVSKNEILKMLWELKIFPILKWVRWQEWINFDKLIDIIFNLQFIFKEFKDITEIDINPIFASNQESIIIDAKFYL
jgi:acetyltransferase